MAWLPDPARSRAVLIGVSRYHRLPAIDAAGPDVTDLAALLMQPEVWGLPAGHCTVVEDPRSAADLLDPIHDAALAAEDALLVYFVGHGLLAENTELYLALPDGTQERLHHAVGFAEVRRQVVTTAAHCRAKVVILDCCFSGRAMSGFLSGPQQFADQTVVEGAYLLTATAETVPALAPPGERYTAFTGALLDTLRDGVPGGPELLDMDTLHARATEDLRARDRPVPQRRSRNDGHLLAIARNVAVSRPEGAPAPHRRPARRWPDRSRHWWWIVAALVALALVLIVVVWRRHEDPGASRAAGPDASGSAAATSAPATPPPAGVLETEEVTVELRKARTALDGRVRITTSNGPFQTTFTVVTPAGTCRVTSLPTGESVVIAQDTDDWVRVTPIDDFPEAPKNAILPVRFSVEWGRSSRAPKGSQACE
jgi:hypothetical protein